jgi:hypothetical protein
MRILHEQFVENFDYYQLNTSHVAGLEWVIERSRAFFRINDFRPELVASLVAAEGVGASAGEMNEAHVPGLKLAIAWTENMNRLAELSPQLQSLLKIAKGSPAPVSSAAEPDDEPSAEDEA